MWLVGEFGGEMVWEALFGVGGLFAVVVAAAAAAAAAVVVVVVS